MAAGDMEYTPTQLDGVDIPFPESDEDNLYVFGNDVEPPKQTYGWEIMLTEPNHWINLQKAPNKCVNMLRSSKCLWPTIQRSNMWKCSIRT